MLVALVADHVRVLHANKVLSANHSDEQVSHRSLNVAVVLPLRISKLLLCLLQPLMIHNDLRLDVGFAFNELILGCDVLSRELGKVNSAILVSVQLLKKFGNDLGAVIIVDAALCQESVHLLSIDPTVPIGVNLGELLCQSFLLRHATERR